MLKRGNEEQWLLLTSRVLREGLFRSHAAGGGGADGKRQRPGAEFKPEPVSSSNNNNRKGTPKTATRRMRAGGRTRTHNAGRPINSSSLLPWAIITEIGDPRGE